MARADVRRLTRELVGAVMTDRDDAAVLAPVLTVMLQTTLADFERYHDSRHATNRIADHDILMARNKAAKA